MSYLSLQQHIQDSQYSEFIEALKKRDENERVERSSIITTNVGFSLPEAEDVITDILSRLPVKYLLQLKSVSKSWYRMITSPSFASIHLQRYYKYNHDMSCFLTLHSIIQAGEVELYGRFVDETLGIYVNSKLDNIVAPPLHYRIYGPCNGIYYLGSYYDGEKRLWNPTINDVKVLPPMIMKPDQPPGLSTRLTRCSYVTYGFGYDPLTKDYKVVSINNYSTGDINHTPSLYVYSLLTDSWKYWGDIPPSYDVVQNNRSHIFLNGCLYWIGCRWNGNFVGIISFNIVTNVMQEIELPKYKKRSKTSLGIYKDSVAFYTVHGVEYRGERSFDIQTFDDGCWTKKFSIPIEGYLCPKGHLKNDVAILNNYCDLVKCDLNTGNISHIAKVDEWCDLDTEDSTSIAKFHKRMYLCESIVLYMESLVSVTKYAT